MVYDSIRGEGKFACGQVKYEIIEERLRIPVNFAGRVLSLAIIDTGAQNCVLRPDTFEQVQDVCDVLPGKRSLTIRGFAYTGIICRLIIYLDAQEGDSIEIEGTAFVPELLPHQNYVFPDFIGFSGFLAKLRFAVDPENDLFYFANLGG